MGILNESEPSVFVISLDVIPTTNAKSRSHNSRLNESNSSDDLEEWSKLESILGIYPGRINQSRIVSKQGSGGIEDERVTVRGLIPGSPAIRSDCIQIGDIIEEVNGMPASLKTIENVLDKLKSPSEVILTIRKGSPVKSTSKSLTSSSSYLNSPLFVQQEVFRLTSDGNAYSLGSREDEFNNTCNDVRGLIAVRILPLISSGQGSYCYPQSFTEKFEQLDETLKAITLTLTDVLYNSFKADIPTSLCAHVGTCTVNVFYWKWPHHLFMLICEQSIMSLDMAHELLLIYKSMVQFLISPDLSKLSLMDSSEDKHDNNSDTPQATTPNKDNRNKEKPEKGSNTRRDVHEINTNILDYIFSSTLSNFQSRFRRDYYFLHLRVAHEIKLSIESHNILTCALMEFETSAWSLKESKRLVGQRKPFLINGTCLYYKDYLIWNDLCSEHASSVHMFVSLMSIIPCEFDQMATFVSSASTSPKNSQLIIWREVFVSYPQSQQYEVYRGRTFLLIVRLKGFTLCTLLESGACAKKYLSLEEDPDVKCPEMYFRKALNILYEIRRTDIETEILNQLSQECSPAISGAEGFLGPDIEPKVEVEKFSAFQKVQQVFSRDRRGVAPNVKVTLRQSSPSAVQSSARAGRNENRKYYPPLGSRRNSPSPNRNSSSTATQSSDRFSTIGSTQSVENAAVPRRSRSQTMRGSVPMRNRSAPPGALRRSNMYPSNQSISSTNAVTAATTHYHHNHPTQMSMGGVKTIHPTSGGGSNTLLSSSTEQRKYFASDFQSTENVAAAAHGFDQPMKTSTSLYSIESRHRFYEEPFKNDTSFELNAETLPVKIVSGVENSLLYYLDLRPKQQHELTIEEDNYNFIQPTAVGSDNNNRVDISVPCYHSYHPSVSQLVNVAGPLHLQIVQNFYRIVSKMRKQFAKKVCYEMGMLFTLRPFGGGNRLNENSTSSSNKKPSKSSKSNQHVIRYWVSGRCFEDGRQVFICHHDSCGQNMSEVAFKLLTTNIS